MSSSENEFSSSAGSNSDSDDDSFKTPAGSTGSANSEEARSDATGSFSSIPCPKDCEPINLGGSSAITASDFHSSDYDAWLVSAPANIPVEKLPNKSISFEENSVITLGNREYELMPYTVKEQHVNLMVLNSEGKARVVDVTLAGELRISEHEEIPPIVIPQFTKQTPQPPTDLKLRHPIYGIDYEEVIQKHSEVLAPKSISKKRRAEDILGGPVLKENTPGTEKKKKRKLRLAV